MGPLELDGTPGEEKMGPLKQESTLPFCDNGALKLVGALEQVRPLKQESTGTSGDHGAPEAS